VRALIVEDNPEIVEFMTLALEAGTDKVDIITTDSGLEAAEMLEKERPDVILLDLGLPDINGFETIKRIRLFSNVPIIIISAKQGENDIVRGLNLGADEYITKPFGQLELLARIKAVLRRRTGIPVGEVIRYGECKFEPGVNRFTCHGSIIPLTRTESIIIGVLLEHRGAVVSYSQLANAVWGEDYPSATETLRVYIRRLRIKIESAAKINGLIKSHATIGYSLSII
jgi:two-component system KDP operon response regulator KdpE